LKPILENVSTSAQTKPTKWTKCPPMYESIKTHIILKYTYIEAQMSQLVFRKSQNGGYTLYVQAMTVA
jgi:hypothetical protein